MRHGVIPEDDEGMGAFLKDVQVQIRYQDGEQQVFLNGENVTGYLRAEEVGRLTSKVSTYPAVRQKLLELQRELARKENVVMDGRDITTHVLPNADLKIYLTASVDERAKRRYLELRAKGETCTPEEIRKDMEERDYRDSHREAAPLRQAPDAVLVDTSEMDVDQMVSHIICLWKEGAMRPD
jgi:cytidylate kinase